MKSKSSIRRRIEVGGAVQGVGFRPFVWRLARDLGLGGWVRNTPEGVEIEVAGDAAAAGLFVERLRSEAPPHAVIARFEVASRPPLGAADFVIRPSRHDPAAAAGEVLPDLATCDDCRREILDPHDRRHGYPFTNCTNCGPRYSIVQSLPYDRAHTTMAGFAMCAACRAEYEDPADRRFHAQPNACPACGPQVDCEGASGPAAIERAAAAIRAGRIVALKGIGGFHLLADARDPEVIARLRDRKKRPEKPLAVMAPSLADAEAICEIVAEEAALLTSAAAPIVLMARRGGGPLPDCLAPGNRDLGVMLPYSPLHHLLMAQLGFPVVATSGNLGDEPICTGNDEARRRLGGIADCFLTHDRPIARPVDDSVVRVVAGREMVLRRSRGHAPAPVAVDGVQPGVLALGGDMKNTFAISKVGQIFLSQHIGDLATVPARDALAVHLRDVPDLCRAVTRTVACDLHPGYHSRAVAEGLARPVTGVQHHHAHIAGCLAEHGIGEEVLGVAWDGTGFGPDGTIWGGEFLLATTSRFTRFAALRPFPLPGGDQAVREPRRAALGMLHAAGIDPEAAGLDPAFDPAELRTLRRMLDRGVNAALTSSAGRLFDAVASLAGVRHRCSFEGQAAIELEALARGRPDPYPFPLDDDEQAGIDWEPALRAILTDVQGGVPPATISARLHRGLAGLIVAVAHRSGKNIVAMSGGCFQNRVLLEGAIAALEEAGFRAVWPQRIPPNDGGLAFGQAVVAATQPTT